MNSFLKFHDNDESIVNLNSVDCIYKRWTNNTTYYDGTGKKIATITDDVSECYEMVLVLQTGREIELFYEEEFILRDDYEMILRKLNALDY